MSSTSYSSSKKALEAEKALLDTIKNLSVSNKKLAEKDKSSPLPELPTDVFELVVERSDYKEQLVLRKVCDSLRSMVDETDPACKSIDFRCAEDHIICEYDDVRVVYAAPGWKDKTPPKKEKPAPEKDTGVKMWSLVPTTKPYGDKPLFENQRNVKVLRDDYEKVAFDDLEWTLKNPKLQLEFLDFHPDVPDQDHLGVRAHANSSFKKQHKKFVALLKSLDHQVSVKKFFNRLFSSIDFFAILQLLKPGALEKISMNGIPSDSNWRNGEAEMYYQKLLSLEQWKQAQELELRYCVAVFPFEVESSFKRFSVEYVKIRKEELIQLRDYFASLKQFEHCTIRSASEINAYGLRFDVGTVAPANEITPYVSHYPIPNSDDYLEFSFDMEEKQIMIQKKHVSS